MTMQPKPQSPASAAPAILRCAGLRKLYRMGDSEIEVLRGVDLSVREGEFIAIEGRSGSGKSTLLHLLGALDQADGGSVVYDQQDFASLSGRRRSQLRNSCFGFVFQFYHLLPELNVLENALLPRMIEKSWMEYRADKHALREAATELLNRLGLGARLAHKPNQLSGGERQRVAIARALINRPRILFADEPTGNLDTQTGRQIMGLLEQFHQESRQTVILVTHDRTLAREADRTLVLQDGRLERTA